MTELLLCRSFILSYDNGSPASLGGRWVVFLGQGAHLDDFAKELVRFFALGVLEAETANAAGDLLELDDSLLEDGL